MSASGRSLTSAGAACSETRRAERWSARALCRHVLGRFRHRALASSGARDRRPRKPEGSGDLHLVVRVVAARDRDLDEPVHHARDLPARRRKPHVDDDDAGSGARLHAADAPRWARRLLQRRRAAHARAGRVDGLPALPSSHGVPWASLVGGYLFGFSSYMVAAPVRGPPAHDERLPDPAGRPGAPSLPGRGPEAVRPSVAARRALRARADDLDGGAAHPGARAGARARAGVRARAGPAAADRRGAPAGRRRGRPGRGARGAVHRLHPRRLRARQLRRRRFLRRRPPEHRAADPPDRGRRGGARLVHDPFPRQRQRARPVPRRADSRHGGRVRRAAAGLHGRALPRRRAACSRGSSRSERRSGWAGTGSRLFRGRSSSRGPASTM